MKTEINLEIDSGINNDCITFQNSPAIELILKNLLNDNMPY